MSIERMVVNGWFRLAWLAVVGLALAACMNNEPEERAAFIAWLQPQAMPEHTGPLRVPDDAQRDAFGTYARHYEVLADYDQVARRAVDVLKAALEHDELHTLAQLLERGPALATDRQALARARDDLQQALGHANAEVAELRQPDEVQRVYAPVYQRIVIDQGARLDVWLATAAAATDDALRVVEYVDRHGDQIAVTADAAAVRDPSVLHELNRLLDILNGHATTIGQARAGLWALAPD
ncbi:DUF3053 family protein [Bordetella genomosp. 7]|uniref:DUF3053 family protein n=1 Tax=Bordetella genomosp. 7 TaxID=1416805 RepID=UPI00113FC8DE|nr:DUF3053 family protein [Bordetella genomosp. 7]